MRVLLPSSTLPAVEKRRRLKLEVTFPLLDLHRAFLIVIDDAILTLGTAYQLHLVDDLLDGVGLGMDRARTRAATERSHPAHHHLRLFARQKHEILLDRNQCSAAHDHWPEVCVIQRDYRNMLAFDVLPDVQLGPVR